MTPDIATLTLTTYLLTWLAAFLALLLIAEVLVAGVGNVFRRIWAQITRKRSKGEQK